jgi:hypothetical protein
MNTDEDGPFYLCSSVFICGYKEASTVLSRAVWENPIVRRELRGFGHRLRDWRLWVGLRLPREPREWGLPAITWFALAPYIQWVLLLALRRLSPSLMPYVDPGGIFEIFLFGLGFYTCIVATVIGATAITHEREQGTWEQVAITPMTTVELLLGYWLSRALPLALGALVSLLTWLLLYPHYVSLLERLGKFDFTQADLFRYGLILLVELLFLSALGVMFSAFCRSSAAAATLALTGAVVIGLLAPAWLIDRVYPAGIPTFPALTLVSVALGGIALLVAGARLKAARSAKLEGRSRRKRSMHTAVPSPAAALAASGTSRVAGSEEEQRP